MKTFYVVGYVCALIGCGGATETPAIEETDSATTTIDSATTPSTDSATVLDSAAPSTDSATADSAPVTTDSGTMTTTETGGTSGEAGKINCGPTLKCTTPQVCCIGFAGGASYSCAATCSGLSAAAKCDGPEDCSGQRCCSGFPSGASCKATCGSGDQDMCHSDGDCAGGKTCKECSTPGGGPAMRFCVEGGKCPF